MSTQLPHEDMQDPMEMDRKGLVMVTIGWILLAFDGIVGVWFFVSLRSGSLFWPAWVVIEGFAGLVLIFWGSRLRSEAGRNTPGNDIQRPAA